MDRAKEESSDKLKSKKNKAEKKVRVLKTLSKILNNIYWEIWPFKFFDLYFNGLDKNWLRQPEYARALVIEKEKEAYFKKTENYEVEELRVVFAGKYASDASFFFPEEHLIIIRSDKNFSLRSNKSLILLYNKLKEHGIECGGHALAGGAEYNKDQDKLMKAIELFVEHIK